MFVGGGVNSYSMFGIVASWSLVAACWLIGILEFKAENGFGQPSDVCLICKYWIGR